MVKKTIKQLIYRIKLKYAVYGFKRKLNRSSVGVYKRQTLFDSKIVLLPIIETSHYKFIQLLLIAKAMQLRGARVLVLVCDGALDICEIRSVQRSDNIVCGNCRIHVNSILPIFNFEIVKFSEFLSDISDLEEITMWSELQKINPKITNCIEDSVIRHFYGNVPKDKKLVDKVKDKHILTAIKSWKVSEALFERYGVNLVLGYMIAYSEFAPIKYYFEQKGISFKIISSFKLISFLIKYDLIFECLFIYFLQIYCISIYFSV